MSSAVKNLADKGVITLPGYAKETHYETLCGSVSYGVSTDMSDVDIYSFCIPPKNVVFPYQASDHIYGFGDTPKGFDQFQQHHIKDPDGKQSEYDVTVFNIVKYFELLRNMSPNVVDTLFVADNYVLHMTDIGQMVRTNRGLFLSKHAYHTYKGFARSEMHKVVNRKYANGKRKDIVERLGYDPKSLYHCRRLIVQVEQILLHGTMDLQLDREALKAIRRGDVSVQDVQSWYNEKESQLDKLYHESNAVPMVADETAIKGLLIDCLESHFGNLNNIVMKSDDTYQQVVNRIRDVMKNSGVY